ncbi:MAG: hypothetical protein ACRD2X_24265, partial [Vicinamibacteraceae bacterium]
ARAHASRAHARNDPTGRRHAPRAAARWEPSPRPYPARITPPEYPAHMEIRRVSHAGTFRLHSAHLFLRHALQDEDIGLEEVADGVWNIVYDRTLLGRIDERTRLITGV